MLIIHENKGLTPHFVSLPGRLAASGYSALAVDLLSRKGGTGAFPDSGPATAALTGTAHAERLVADLRAGLDELLRRVPRPQGRRHGFLLRRRDGVVAAGRRRGPAGGGGAVLRDAPRRRRLLAGSPKRPSSAFYGETDARVNATSGAAKAALDRRQAAPRGQVVARRRPRLLQRHRAPVQRHRGGRRLHGAARLVRPLPVMRAR